MADTSLATKYRPQRFSDVVEQDVIKTTLGNQIKKRNFKNCLLFCGGAGTGKTTNARIFANEINNFQGRTIEIDAASHNGVDDARRLIEDSKTQSLDSEYKTFLIDECHMMSVQAWNALLKLLEEPPKKSIFLFCLEENGLVVTETGIKKIKDVSVGDSVWVGNRFSGVSNVFDNGEQMCLKITLANGEIIKCTPNHKIKVLNGTVEVWKRADELAVGDNLGVYHSSANYDDISNLTSTECWFLGYLTGNGHYTNHALEFFTPQFKLDYVHNKLDIGISEGWLSHYEDVRDNGSITTQIHFPFGYMRKWYDKTGCHCEYKRGEKSLPDCVYRMSTAQFVEFMQGWFDADGGKFGTHFLNDEKGVSIYCAMPQLVFNAQQLLIAHGFDVRLYAYTREGGTLPGGRTFDEEYEYFQLYRSHISGCFNDSTLMSWLYDHRLKGSTPYIPEAQVLYQGGRRINPTMVKKSQLPDLQGNKWYMPIKSIEEYGVCHVYDIEVPETHEFIYNGIKVHNCTTDPQKIPPAVLSRLQKYDFQRISLNGIINRLKYIIESENAEGVNETITFEDSALEYIAKRADGGMRDAITLLENAIGYNSNLTLNNVLSALGSAKYDTMFDLTDALNIMDKKKVIEIIEAVHYEGIDLKQFMKQYSVFVLELCKYDLLRSFEFIQMPTTYLDRISKYSNDDFAFINQLLGEILSLNNAIKYETVPKPLIESTLLLLCMEA